MRILEMRGTETGPHALVFTLERKVQKERKGEGLSDRNTPGETDTSRHRLHLKTVSDNGFDRGGSKLV